MNLTWATPLCATPTSRDPQIIVDLMAPLPHVFVYIVYVFATIVVHFCLLFNPSIFNISPPPLIAPGKSPIIKEIGKNLSNQVFYIFCQKSHLETTNNIFVWSLRLLTTHSKLERKKSTRFFFRPIRENPNILSLPVEKHRCLGMRMISKAHGNSGGSRRLEDATSR